MSNHNPEYAILIHYSEIALKKNNRSFFERKFVENITKHIKNLQYSKVRRISSRIFVEGIQFGTHLQSTYLPGRYVPSKIYGQ